MSSDSPGMRDDLTKAFRTGILRVAAWNRGAISARTFQSLRKCGLLENLTPTKRGSDEANVYNGEAHGVATGYSAGPLRIFEVSGGSRSVVNAVESVLSPN